MRTPLLRLALRIGTCACLVTTAPSARAGGPVTWSWPDPGWFPCYGTLQACVDYASPDDTVEIQTDEPIYEASITIAKSLTLRAAPGFMPFIAGDVNGVGGVYATTPPNGNHRVRIEGLRINHGGIQVTPVTTGTTTIELVDNGIEFVSATGINVSASLANGPVTLLISGNALDAVAGDSSTGIAVVAGGFPVSGRVANNRVVMEGGYSQEGLYLQNYAANSSIDVIANRIIGSDYGYGDGSATETALKWSRARGASRPACSTT